MTCTLKQSHDALTKMNSQSADHAGADGQILAVGDELNEMVQREQRHLYDNDDDDEEILLASVRTNIVQVAQHKGIKAGTSSS